jgi:hypothetical protein
MRHVLQRERVRKAPDSFIAYEILCSSSQLRHESFLLHKKGFSLNVRFASLSRNGRCKYILNTPGSSDFSWWLAWTMDRRYPSPDQNRFQSLAALFILESASSNPLTMPVCLHYVSLLRHNMNQTLRFNQRPRAWKLASECSIICYVILMQSRGRSKLARVYTAAGDS